MADLEIKDLQVSEGLSTTDVIAEQRDTGGDIWVTRKFTLGALGLFVNKVLQYASDLHTTNKTIIGAINEILSSAGGGVELTDTLEAGETSLVFTNNAITATSKIDWYIEEDFYGIVAPTSFTTDAVNHTLTLTFDEQEEDVDIKVVIK